MVRQRIKHAHAYVIGEGLGPLLIRSVAGTGLVRIGAMAASFLVGVQLARGLGVKGYGYYGLALSIITIAGIPGELGLPRLVTREVAGAAARKDMPHLFGVLRWARHTAIRLSAIMALFAIAAAYFFKARSPSGLWLAILLGAPIIPLMALARINGGALQGLHHVVRGQIPANLLRPIILSALIFAAVASGADLGARGAMALSSLSAAAALVIAWWWLKERLPPAQPAEEIRAGRKWLGSSIPMALTDGMRALQSELSTLLLGLIAAPSAVGLFRVANATATTAAAGLLIVGHATMPTIARLYAERDRERLQRLITYSARLQLAGVCTLSLPLLVAPGFLLSLAFGSEFADAAAALRIIAVAQIINAAFGPNVVLLNMTHNERRVTRAMAVGLVLNIATVLLLGTIWRARGAAVGMLFAMVCWNLLTWSDAQRILGLDTSVIGRVFRVIRGPESASQMR
jgi:O-antigen/teichoic acid export membrane protein